MVALKLSSVRAVFTAATSPAAVHAAEEAHQIEAVNAGVQVMPPPAMAGSSSNPGARFEALTQAQGMDGADARAGIEYGANDLAVGASAPPRRFPRAAQCQHAPAVGETGGAGFSNNGAHRRPPASRSEVQGRRHDRGSPLDRR